MVILDMRDVTLIADYFVVVSAMNVIQVQSIAEAVDAVLSAQGMALLNHMGRPRAHWILLDYGALVVHVFTEEERNYYNLERLWGDAAIVSRSSVPQHS